MFTSDNALWSYDTGVSSPAAIEKDGVYYLCYTLGNDIGIAWSESPTGGFSSTSAALIENASDPYVLNDGDKTYIYYTRNSRLCVSELADNMVTLADGETDVTPDGYTDGASVIKDGDSYYMIFSSGSEYSADYTTKYAAMSSPVSAPVVKGTLLTSDDADIYGSGNASAVIVNGNAYIAYQRRHYEKSVADTYVTPNKEVSYHVLCVDALNTDNGTLTAAATADGVLEPETYTGTTGTYTRPAANGIIIPAGQKIAKGETKQLIYTVVPVNAADKSVTWSVSDTSIAEISDNGVITANGAGEITVTATLKSNPAVSVSAAVELYDRAAIAAYTADYASNVSGGQVYMIVNAEADALYDVNIDLTEALPVEIMFNDDSSTKVIKENESDITLAGIYLKQGENTITVNGSFYKANNSDTVKYTGTPKLNSISLNKAGEPNFKLLSYVTDGSEHHGSERIYVGNSLHLALSADGGKTYYPVNNGMGVLFQETDFEEAGILPEKANDIEGVPWDCGYDKCMTDANVFRTADGYGVIATRTGSAGKTDKMHLLESDRTDGYVEIYTSGDLDRYDLKGYIKVADSKVYNPSCVYENGAYTISFSDKNGNRYKASTAGFGGVSEDLESTLNLTASVKPSDASFAAPGTAGIGHNAIGTGVIDITADEYEAIGSALNTAYNTSAKPFDTVTVSAGADLASALPKRATQNYSDGGEQDFNVVWDTSGIDTSVPGTYYVSGKQVVPNYDSDLVQKRADPSMYLYNDKYYFIGTWDVGSQLDCHISEADRIEDLQNAKDNVITNIDGTFRAPELHVIGGRLSVLGSKPYAGGSQIMQLRDGGDPTNINDWSELRPIVRKGGASLDLGMTLDMTYLNRNGKHYYIWPVCTGAYDTGSGDTNTGDRGGDGKSDDFTWISDIYIAEFDPSNPAELTSDIIRIARPNYAFERANTQVDEGPFALVHDGRVYITIATNEVGVGYNIKLLTLKDGGDPMKAEDWIEYQRPRLSRADYWPEPGPGHSSFTKNKDGDDILVYHRNGHLWGIERSSSCRLVHCNGKGEPVLNVNDFLADKNNTAMVKVVVQ